MLEKYLDSVLYIDVPEQTGDHQQQFNGTAGHLTDLLLGYKIGKSILDIRRKYR